MKSFIEKYHRPLFYAIWFLIGLLQAMFTGVIDDEAYYWVYSQFPDWGYFDHPPMTAMLIKWGEALFPGVLGLRLIPVLMNTLTILMIEKIADVQKPVIFYALAISLAAVQLGGFLAVPDTPLVFFTAFFFLIYKNFLKSRSLANVLLLGLAMAALLYSKYHGVLVILFTLLSNLKLLGSYRIYLAGIFAIALYFPHLWWQYENDFITLQYHFGERYRADYYPALTFDYIGGQLLLAGPIAALIILPAALLQRSGDHTGKALRFTLIGIYLFFLFSSFKGRVYANWTAPVLIPLLVLSYQYLESRSNWTRWLYRTVPVTIILLIFARLALVVDILPLREIQKRYHGWKEWPAKMKEQTGGLPVVFHSSYQRASQYWYHTGVTAFSLNDYRKRRNNFDLWPIEDSLLGRKVFVADLNPEDGYSDSLQTPMGSIEFKADSQFYSFTRARLLPDQYSYTTVQNESVLIKGKVEVPAAHRNFLNSGKGDARLLVSIFSGRDWLMDIDSDQELSEIAATGIFQLQLHAKLDPGEYILRCSLQSKNGYTTRNSNNIILMVEAQR